MSYISHHIIYHIVPYTTSYHIIMSYMISYHTVPYHTSYILYHIIPCHIISCHIYHIISYITSYHAISYITSYIIYGKKIPDLPRNLIPTPFAFKFTCYPHKCFIKMHDLFNFCLFWNFRHEPGEMRSSQKAHTYLPSTLLHITEGHNFTFPDTAQ